MLTNEEYFEYREFVEDRARRLRWECGLQRPPYDPRVVADALKVMVREAELDPGIEGYLDKSGKQWCAFVSSKSPLARRRFTLAHELGHFVLMKAATSGSLPGLVRYRTDGTCLALHQDGLEEKLCNRFAQELLLPDDEIRDRLCPECVGAISVVSIAKEFGVSLQSVATKVVTVLGRHRSGCSLWDLSAAWPLARWRTGIKNWNRGQTDRLEALVKRTQGPNVNSIESWNAFGARRERFQVEAMNIQVGRLALVFVRPKVGASRLCLRCSPKSKATQLSLF